MKHLFTRGINASALEAEELFDKRRPVLIPNCSDILWYKYMSKVQNFAVADNIRSIYGKLKWRYEQ